MEVIPDEQNAILKGEKDKRYQREDGVIGMFAL
jgi:hypothetical protein